MARSTLSLFTTVAFSMVVGFSASAVVHAQTCPNGTDTFWKNDTLAQVPSGFQNVSIIPGLCEGEAVGTYFQMPPGTPPQKLNTVSVGFGHTGGGGGFNATANVEIYEGSVTFNGNGTAVLGTKIFDLNADQSASVQLISTGLNTVDLSNFNVVVSDDYVVAFRMNINPNGSCGGGYAANFFTDNGGSGTCTPGLNLLDELSTGWLDPSTWSILCPLFYAGNWVIRACTEGSGTLASATPRNGAGINPAGFASLTNPVLGTNWVSTIDIATPGALASIVSLGTGGVAPPGIILSGTVVGELLCLPPFLPANVGFGAHSIAIPNDVALLGANLFAHGSTFVPGTIALNNAIDLVLGL